MRVVVLVAALIVGVCGVANASDGDGDVQAAHSGLFATWSESTPGSVSHTSDDGDPIVRTFETSSCAIGGAQTCAALDHCDDGSIMTFTTYVTESGEFVVGGDNCPRDLAGASHQVTPGLVATAFRRIPLPASEVVVQPPNGRTLVNFRTNFYTERDEFTRVVRLLGQRVELRIWPARFGWRFGDGVERWTTTPGDKYPHLEVTHRYLSKGRVAPSVATTYAAQFRVGGGPWRDVNGTVTIPGTPQGLRVVTARPVLVGGS